MLGSINRGVNAMLGQPLWLADADSAVSQVSEIRCNRPVAGWRVWLAANYTTIIAVVRLLFGVVLSTRGVGDLVG